MRFQVKAHEHEAEFETMTRAHDYLTALGYKPVKHLQYSKTLTSYPGFMVTTHAIIEITK